MAAFSRLVLSGSVDGRPIVVANTSLPGVTVHTGPVATGTLDHVYLWAQNTSNAARQVVMEFGSTATGDETWFSVPAQDGAYALCPGWPLAGAATAWIVRCFATATSGLNVAGYIDRYA